MVDHQSGDDRSDEQRPVLTGMIEADERGGIALRDQAEEEWVRYGQYRPVSRAGDDHKNNQGRIRFDKRNTTKTDDQSGHPEDRCLFQSQPGRQQPRGKREENKGSIHRKKRLDRTFYGQPEKRHAGDDKKRAHHPEADPLQRHAGKEAQQIFLAGKSL